VRFDEFVRALRTPLLVAGIREAIGSEDTGSWTAAAES